MGLEAYLTRDDWGAGPLRSGHVVDPAQFLALRVHHTVMVMPDYDRDGHLHGDLDDVKRYLLALQAARPDLGSEVPYSFVVFPGSRLEDFIVAEGRGEGVTGAHTRGQNSSTYGVVLPGNYEIETPTAGQVAGVRWVGATKLRNPTGAGVTLGHREVPGESTACPGANTMPLLPAMQPPFTPADAAATPARPKEITMHLVRVVSDDKPYDTAGGAHLDTFPGALVLVDGGGRHGMTVVWTKDEEDAFRFAGVPELPPRLNRTTFFWKYGVKLDAIDHRPRF